MSWSALKSPPGLDLLQEFRKKTAIRRRVLILLPNWPVCQLFGNIWAFMQFADFLIGIYDKIFFTLPLKQRASDFVKFINL